MNQSHNPNLDLNLLKVFEAVLEEGGVTAAGRRLGLTQSAVSHALNRLRHQVGDPLFIRTATGMQPTPRALEMGARVREALLQLRASLEPALFEPRETRRRFSLAASSYASAVLLPDLLAYFAVEAPGAAVRVRPADAGMVEALDQGRLDVAVSVFGRSPERYGHQALFDDRLAWVVGAGGPLPPGPLSLEALAAIPHLIVATDEPASAGETVVDHGLERRVLLSGGEALQSALDARGLTRRIAASVPDSQTALALLARTPTAALLPRRLALRHAAALDLRVFDPPHAAPALEVAMIWRKDQDSPAAAWFRARLTEAALATTAREPG